jgi:hypothetical protein
MGLYAALIRRAVLWRLLPLWQALGRLQARILRVVSAILVPMFNVFISYFWSRFVVLLVHRHGPS